MRGFMIDCARCLENREYYRRLIRFMAQRGMNTLIWHFSDDQGLSVDFPSVPGLADPHAYSEQEVRELVAYARDHGVDIIPELETLGHSRYITRHARYRHLRECDEDFTAICPVHPETRKLMRELIADVARMFSSPWVHVGMDEVKLGDHPLTQEALKTQSKTELWADYVRFIHGEVTAQGKQMMMWLDQPSYETGILETLPRDILLALWQYTPDVPPTLAQTVLDEGFDALLCPALITYDQQAYPGSIALPNIERMSSFQTLSGKGRVRGIATTIWTPMRYLHDCLWPGISAAAAMMEAAGGVDMHAVMADYLRDFYGVEAGKEAADALVKCFELAPERKEYLGLLKADDIEQSEGELESKVAAWLAISTTLQRLYPAVSCERQAFGSLVSFIRFMAYLYRRGALLKCPREDETAWLAVLQEGHSWLGTLESIWDRERFKDDKRKVMPVYAWEQNEYLIICLRQSLTQLAPRCEAATTAADAS